MRTRINNFFMYLNQSYWFVPAIMMTLAFMLWFITISIDRTITIPSNDIIDLLLTGGADGARNLLGTLAGSMITTAGVIFSITIAALAQASGQLGPRLLKNFMRDKGNQITLGTFVATFLYCLLVLRVIRNTNLDFVPHISVTTSLILAIASVIVLVYYIDHIAHLMQADYIISLVGDDLEEQLESALSDEKQREAREVAPRNSDDIPDDFNENTSEIIARKSGYLQGYVTDSLLNYADEHDLILNFKIYPGQFVIENDVIAAVYPQQELSDELIDNLHNALLFGENRLNMQDILYYIDQLVEIALRALSPGVNDPFTAIACIDQLSIALSKIADKDIPLRYYYKDEQLRLIFADVTFEQILNKAYNQIRRYGRSDLDVLIHLLDTLQLISVRANSDEKLNIIKAQADKIVQGARQAIAIEADVQMVEASYDKFIETLHH